MTRDLEVKVPEDIARLYRIKPGDEIEWQPDGDGIRLILSSPEEQLSVEERLKLFDESTRRQRAREQRLGPVEPTEDRGWTREELYDRGCPD
ncbi:MAG TPA: AbrB/MazE/SpoVT family DNA-binding domain-containing protein [Thermoanaerobaculia bacterium]|nr:AbrB/MazE/SpoVT family DNA-binding domain-containing protein [Thermoanaerobaculia bacterium]